MDVWIYLFDELKPIDLDSRKIFNAIRGDPMDLFNAIKDLLSDYGINNIKDVKLYRIYIDRNDLDIVIEFIIHCEYGEISLKLINSRKPFETLRKYYSIDLQT